MKFYKVNSDRRVNVNISNYRVDWDKKCRSNFQFSVKQWLRPYWAGHVCLEEFRVPGSRMTCDLVNLTVGVVVETSGDQHRAYNPFFHLKSRENYLSQIKRDVAKQEWAEKNGLTFVEIFKEDIPLSREFFLEKYAIHL